MKQPNQLEDHSKRPSLSVFSVNSTSLQSSRRNSGPRLRHRVRFKLWRRDQFGNLRRSDRGETEWERTVMEMGPIVAVLWLGTRLIFDFSLFRITFRCLRRGNPLPWLLFGQSLVDL